MNNTNFCVVHGTPWFKKGAMKSFAHPIKDGTVTVGWCNRPQDYVEPDLVDAAVKEGAVITSVVNKSSGKNRSFALAYAKDIGVALIQSGEKTNASTIIELAKKFDKYLETGE